MKRVHIVRGSAAYSQMFLEAGWEVVPTPQQADLVCFTGGEDVTPAYYGEKPHPRTGHSVIRDMVERSQFNLNFSHEIPMVGICRGGQFLNVLSGGKMYQDVSNHCRDHWITDKETGELIFASSTHHQMMRPGPGGQVLAIADEGGWKEHVVEGKVVRQEDKEEDVEVVFYPLTRCLCFQPHPEFMDDALDPLRFYFFSLIEKYLVKEF